MPNDQKTEPAENSNLCEVERLLIHIGKVLPMGWTVRIFVESSWHYAYVQRHDGSVFNPDVHMRTTIKEQLQAIIASLPPVGTEFR